jgi:dUTP pyrophosphatase
MGNNTFNLDRLTEIVTKKYSQSLSGIDLDSGDDEDMVNSLSQMSEELENLLNEEVSVKPTIGFINESNNKNPEYIYEGDSGFDLRANLNQTITLKPLERFLVPTGLKFQIPEGFEVQVRPRSGLAAKQGLSVLNTPGTVDQGYTGEVKVILVNLSNDTVSVNHGDRIAQAVVCPVLTKKTINLTEVKSVSNTDRGDGGFGSTGK